MGPSHSPRPPSALGTLMIHGVLLVGCSPHWCLTLPAISPSILTGLTLILMRRQLRIQVKALRRTWHSCAPHWETCSVPKGIIPQPEFGGCPPIPALAQHLPVSFLHPDLQWSLQSPQSLVRGHHLHTGGVTQLSPPPWPICRSGKRGPSSSSCLQRASPPSCACGRHCTARELQGNPYKRRLFGSFLFLVPGTPRSERLGGVRRVTKNTRGFVR